MYHLRVFNMLGKTFFPTIFTIFIKKKFSFCCFLHAKFIKFCQGHLGLSPAGPWDNQALPAGQLMRDDFSDGPGRVGKWEMIFPTDQAGKRKMNFPTVRDKLSKEKWVFQRWEKKKKKEDKWHCGSVRHDKTNSTNWKIEV